MFMMFAVFIYFLVMPFVCGFIDHKMARRLMFVGLVLVPLIPAAILRAYIYVSFFHGDSVATAVLVQYAAVTGIYFLGRLGSLYVSMRKRARDEARKRRWQEAEAA
jgi:ACR3 family arsenite efflux pump ArsB